MDLKIIFNLQLFAEGGDGSDNSAEGGGDEKPPAKDSEGKKVDINSEEFEIELNKRLETKLAERINAEKSKWEKDYKKKAEHEKKEQERLSKLSEDERREAEWKQKNDELEAREEALKLKEQQAEAVSVLNSRGIPVVFMPFLVTGTDNDKNMENITTFEKELKKLVDEKVKEKLKGKTPNTGNSSSIEKNNNSKRNSIIDIIKKNQVKR